MQLSESRFFKLFPLRGFWGGGGGGNKKAKRNDIPIHTRFRIFGDDPVWNGSTQFAFPIRQIHDPVIIYAKNIFGPSHGIKSMKNNFSSCKLNKRESVECFPDDGVSSRNNKTRSE